MPQRLGIKISPAFVIWWENFWTKETLDAILNSLQNFVFGIITFIFTIFTSIWDGFVFLTNISSSSLSAIPIWFHVLVAFFTIFFFFPPVREVVKKASARSISVVYRIAKFLCPAAPPDEVQRQEQFSKSLQHTTNIQKKEMEWCHLNGWVLFKMGAQFPYIFKECHVQLYKCTIIVRDGAAMRKYNEKRLALTKSNPSSGNGEEKSVVTSTTTSATSATAAAEQSLTKIDRINLPPPKPTAVIDLSGGKCINSTLPMTLKLVTAKSERGYLQFADTAGYKLWANAIEKNLRIELAQNWRREAQSMQHAWQTQKQKELAQQQNSPIPQTPPVVG